ncbi:hypothetical protein BDW42DRAFT_159094 [Aspergillus taichungensis]|uniref:Uncharacterized protein n=1 Tax=Aspergillus taichungensis TaxID=482145 RepID=A0A2J5I8M0_9EURO|nr:hypothetical protein BDW42DRAFT_159094 [Aspergillus taichungensis]
MDDRSCRPLMSWTGSSISPPVFDHRSLVSCGQRKGARTGMIRLTCRSLLLVFAYLAYATCLHI